TSATAGAGHTATATRRCTARATIRSFTIRSCATIRSSPGPTATAFTATDSTGIGIGRTTAVGTRSPTVRTTCSSTAYATARACRGGGGRVAGAAGAAIGAPGGPLGGGGGVGGVGGAVGGGPRVRQAVGTAAAGRLLAAGEMGAGAGAGTTATVAEGRAAGRNEHIGSVNESIRSVDVGAERKG